MVQEIEVTDASIELHDDDEYALCAYGTLTIEGPLGTLDVRKSFRAAPTHDGLMADDEVREHIDYYHDDSNHDNQPFTDAVTEWPAAAELLNDEQRFLQECEVALTADPEVEYVEALRGRRFGVADAIADAHTIVMASHGQTGLTEAQAEAYALRDIHDVPRKWAAVALGKDASNVDNLQRAARQKAEAIQRVADALDGAQ